MRCLVCDCDLSIVGIKPQVCSKDLCAFKYEELGLGLELSAQILRSPELIDLLISFFAASVANGKSGRIGLFFPSNVKRQQKNGSVRSFVLPESHVLAKGASAEQVDLHMGSTYIHFSYIFMYLAYTFNQYMYNRKMLVLEVVNQ